MFPIATTAGLLLMLAYPPIILAYDAWLKSRSDPTITADVSASRSRRVEVTLYGVLWLAALALHFDLGWFGGWPWSTPSVGP